MKKYVFTTGLLLALGISATAQTRLSLYEEFTGENCPPCASVNPGLWTMMNSSSSQDKVVIIKYQVPIPSAGPIYREYTTDADARLSYYRANFAPWGNMDGALPVGIPASQQNAHHVGYLNQTHINNSAAVPSDFKMSTAHEWLANGDSIKITVTVTATNAHAGTNVKLRTALIETLEFDRAPGSNGEKVFHNVVRKMYPSAAGTQAVNSWSANQTETYTIVGATPAHLVERPGSSVVVWLQDDSDKAVLQASKSSIATSTNNISYINELNLFPNPTKGNVTLSINTQLATTATVTVTNVLGQQVIANQATALKLGQNDISVDVTALNAGVYMMNITTDAGTMTKKFTKN